MALRRRVMLERSRLADRARAVGHRRGPRGGLRVRRGVQPCLRAGVRRRRRARSPDPGDVRAHWLAAPNGVHFHPPLNLWVHESEEAGPDARVRPARPARPRRHHPPASTSWRPSPTRTTGARCCPGHVRAVVGRPEPSVAAVLEHHVFEQGGVGRGVRGRRLPRARRRRPGRRCAARHEAIAPRWLARVPRRRAAPRVGRPAHRRAVRPARVLPGRQRDRPRPVLRRPSAPARAADAPRSAATRSTTATRSPGTGGGTRHDHHLLHGLLARRLHRDAGPLAGLADLARHRRARADALRGVPGADRRVRHGRHDLAVDPRPRRGPVGRPADLGDDAPHVRAGQGGDVRRRPGRAGARGGDSRSRPARTSGWWAAGSSSGSSTTPGCSTRSGSSTRRSPSAPAPRCCPRHVELRLEEVERNRDFACLRHSVVR